jgi:hypothetical protein
MNKVMLGWSTSTVQQDHGIGITRKPKSYSMTAYQVSHAASQAVTIGTAIWKMPVPVFAGLPITTLALGLVKSSKSPKRVASDKKPAVVSKDAFRKGDGEFAMPVRLKGL